MAWVSFLLMKQTLPLSAGLFACTFLAAVSAQDINFSVPPTSGAAAPPPAAPAQVFTEAQLAEEFGWIMAKRTGVGDLDFTPAEVAGLLKGIGGATSGAATPPYDPQVIGPQMEAFMQKKQAAYLAKLKQASSAQSVAFFAKLDQDGKATKTPSGLRYEIITPGDGPNPKPTDMVTVNYTGTLIDGTVFDTSLKPAQAGGTAAPAQFQLDGVIPGWTEGIQKIAKGGKIKLYIPANLAYGDDGRSGIPPGSTLIFDVDLLDIKAGGAAGAGAAPMAPAAPTP
jgi:FKBP-type peptidyl-prolyl cis-trans isomerase